MTYLLDSDVVNYAVKGDPAVALRLSRAAEADADFILCPVVHFEYTRYLRLKRASRVLREYHELVDSWTRAEIIGDDWDVAADLWARRHRVGRPISDADLLIAVTALKTGAVLVTNNVAHYEGLGVVVERWTGSA